MENKAILYDPTRCTGCRGCQVACKQWNQNDKDKGEKTFNFGSYENPPDLSPQTWMKTTFTEIEKNGKVKWLFNRRSCMHCNDAACIMACPNGTVFRNEFGTVSHNKDTCTGCGYCVEACPFDVPRLEGNMIFGFTKMSKCGFCTQPGFNRIIEGWEPACVKTCPTSALIYGNRDELVNHGRDRVNALIAKGSNHAYLYGDKELNGLHVMYVLDESPETYGLPANPQVSPVTFAWKGVLQPLGWAAGGLAIVGLALNYLIAREAKVKRESQSKKKEEQDGARD
jgi:formate dehydrogenase beta subunit